MEYLFDTGNLKLLWSALKEPAYPSLFTQAESVARRIFAKGWAFNSDIEDILYYNDSRFGSHHFNVIKFSKLLGIHWERVCFRPKSKSRDTIEFDAIRSEDAALLLIILERLGFQTDPASLIKLLLPGIASKKKQILNNAELEIFWYSTTKDKYGPLVLKNGQDWRKMKVLDSFPTPNRYKISVRGITDEPDEIEIRSPKYRRRAIPFEVTCDICGAQWRKGDPESSANHRKEHKKRVLYLDPQPIEKMIKELELSSDPELVTTKSPAWKHKEMYIRALGFKRELGFDFIQWQSDKGDNDPHAHGYLFVDESKVIVGACSFKYRKSKGEIRYWSLDWVWICPQERRKGHLNKRWQFFRQKFGDFNVSFPVSDNMKSFLERKGESHLMTIPA